LSFGCSDLGGGAEAADRQRGRAPEKSSSIEVVRRGDEGKEVIIPLPPHLQAQKEARAAAGEDAPRERINLTPDVPPEKKESLPLD